MYIRSNRGFIRLSRRQSVELNDSAGITITCISGCIWITQHRDTRDIIIAPSESFAIDRRGLTIVQALAESTVRVDEPVRERRRLAMPIEDLLRPVCQQLSGLAARTSTYRAPREAS